MASHHFALTSLRLLKKHVEGARAEDAAFEKMGAIMADNGCRIFGMYDELTTFLTQINLYKGRGLADSHELALFLQLYNGHPLTRNTGIPCNARINSMDCNTIVLPL